LAVDSSLLVGDEAVDVSERKPDMVQIYSELLLQNDTMQAQAGSAAPGASSIQRRDVMKA
jgi:hypothetical protein